MIISYVLLVSGRQDSHPSVLTCYFQGAQLIGNSLPAGVVLQAGGVLQADRVDRIGGITLLIGAWPPAESLHISHRRHLVRLNGLSVTWKKNDFFNNTFWKQSTIAIVAKTGAQIFLILETCIFYCFKIIYSLDKSYKGSSNEDSLISSMLPWSPANRELVIIFLIIIIHWYLLLILLRAGRFSDWSRYFNQNHLKSSNTLIYWFLTQSEHDFFINSAIFKDPSSFLSILFKKGSIKHIFSPRSFQIASLKSWKKSWAWISGSIIFAHHSQPK